MLVSCNDENLIRETSSVSLSTKLDFKFPAETFSHLAEKTNNSSFNFKNCSKINISKWHSSYESDIYNAHNAWIYTDLENIRPNLFRDNNLAIGYTSYRATFTRWISDGFKTDKWNLIPIKDKSFNEKLYKRYVGVTRGAVSSYSINSFYRNIIKDPFIPLNNNESTLWGTDKGRSFRVTSKDISNAKAANSNLYDRTIILEMTPVNSILDIILENRNESLYLGVWSKNKLFIIPPFNKHQAETKKQKRAILNLSEMVAASNISCKVLALRLMPDKNVPANNTSLSFEMLRNTFTIMNGGGNGQNLFKEGEKIIGNQRYYVQDKRNKNKQVAIVLRNDDLILNVNLLINCHLSFEDTDVINKDWDW
jgi:hypothetical protein